MAAKSVQIKATMGQGFKIESKIRDHTVYIDQPKQAGGTDAGPTPLEYFQFSLAGCIASIARIAAMQQKIDLRSVDVEVDGELNLDVLLGKNKEDRSGFGGLTAKVKIDADLSPEEKKAFLHDVDRRCPISDNIQNVTAVNVELVE